MVKLILFAHLLGSVGMGFYLLMPFLIQRLVSKPEPSLGGFVSVLVTCNRVGQYLLIVQFLTGGYLIAKADYSYLWMGLIGVVFLGMAACAGIMGKPLTRLRDALLQGRTASAETARIRILGTLVGALFIVMLFLMKYPELFV